MWKTIFQLRRNASRNHYATLPWFGTKIAQKQLKGSKQKHEALRFSSRRETPRSHVLNFRATSGHNVLYMRSDVSIEMSRFRLPSSGRRRLLLKVHTDVDLTDRFHVAVRLFSDRSQMTSKCGKHKRRGARGNNWVCHWYFYHILTSSVIYYWTDAQQHGIYLFHIIKKKPDAMLCTDQRWRHHAVSRRGILGGTQYRNTVRKNGKYRNTASKIV